MKKNLEINNKFEDVNNDESKKEKKKKKLSLNWLKKIPSIVKFIVLMIVMVGIFALGIKYSQSLKHEETVLEFGFKDVGELVTQEWYGRILEDSTKDRKIFNKFSIPFTDSRIIFSLDVEVTAGLNFEEIEYELKENEITIKLPKAKVYKYYQVPNTFNSYLDDESWFTNINSKERHDLEDTVVDKGKQQALDSGLLEKADKNAKTIIEQMIKSQDKKLEIKWDYK